MFFKIYKVNTGKKLYPNRHVAFMAMLGEDKDGKRELFYLVEDFTTYPFFHESIFHDKGRELLTAELRQYGYTPLPDKLGHLESQFTKKLKYAIVKNIKLTDKRLQELVEAKRVSDAIEEEKYKLNLKGPVPSKEYHDAERYVK